MALDTGIGCGFPATDVDMAVVDVFGRNVRASIRSGEAAVAVKAVAVDEAVCAFEASVAV